MQLNIMNFRDVSGYRNRYGEMMKPGKIFRGAALDRLTPEEVAYMEEKLGIRYILDYRDEGETTAKPDVTFAGAEYLRIGAMKGSPEREREMEERRARDQQMQGRTRETRSLDFATLLRDPETRAMLMKNQEHLTNCYRYMPFGNPAYEALFERVLRGDGGVYFHCSAGKDRTGLSAMLIMMALGMNEEDIVHEYMLSNVYLKPVNEGLCRSCGISEEEAVQLASMLGVVEKNIRLSMASIRERYSSFEEYLEQEYGIDETAREKLRRIYCE